MPETILRLRLPPAAMPTGCTRRRPNRSPKRALIDPLTRFELWRVRSWPGNQLSRIDPTEAIPGFPPQISDEGAVAILAFRGRKVRGNRRGYRPGPSSSGSPRKLPRCGSTPGGQQGYGTERKWSWSFSTLGVRGKILCCRESGIPDPRRVGAMLQCSHALFALRSKQPQLICNQLVPLSGGRCGLNPV